MSADPARWAVGVVIPACNEEATIEACIRSVQLALAAVRICNSWVVVVADSCTDQTAQRAQAALGASGEVMGVSVRSAGASRRAGVARVLARLSSAHPETIWLANTDADTTVSRDWIDVQLALADSGVTGVAGIVRLSADACDEAHEVFKATYLTRADGSHSHVHGANLSVRADAYQDVGGWSDLALAEDHCLWKRLRHRGWRTLASVSSVVTTSARLRGRAAGGFADTLRLSVEATHGAS